MTARVCPVHGEWSATGICRWCEPEETPLPAKPLMYLGIKVNTREEAGEIFADMLGPPPDVAKILRTYEPWYLARIGFMAIHLLTAADLPIQPPAVLEYQHAALRWERVARRWATKHGPWTLRDFAQQWQLFFDKLVALAVKQIEETLKEPKP
jgi:hypothetical protein